MKHFSCLHYNTCINSNEPLCNDSKCSIIKKYKINDRQERIESVRQYLDRVKKQLGIDDFSELTEKGISLSDIQI